MLCIFIFNPQYNFQILAILIDSQGTLYNIFKLLIKNNFFIIQKLKKTTRDEDIKYI